MASILRYIEELIEVTEYDLARLEVWLRHRRRGHPFRPVAGRFAGLYYVDPKTGVTIVATQTLTVGTSFTAPLVFTDANGVTGPGPIGEVSASDPSVSIGLSADGQAANVVMTATLPTPATLTWHDPAGAVPDFTVDVTDAAAVFVPTSGGFGTFAEGNTP